MINKRLIVHIFYALLNISLAILEYIILFNLLLKINNILALIIIVVIPFFGIGIALYNQFSFPKLVKDDRIEDTYLNNLANFVIFKWKKKYNITKKVNVFILNDFQRPNPAFTLGNDIYIVKKYAKKFSYYELVSLISHELGHVRSSFPNIVFAPLLRLDMLITSISSNLLLSFQKHLKKEKKFSKALNIVFAFINFIITLPSIIIDSLFFMDDENFANKTAVDLGYIEYLGSYYGKMAKNYGIMDYIYDTFRHPSPYAMNKKMLRYLKKSKAFDLKTYNDYRTIFALQGYTNEEKGDYSRLLGSNQKDPSGLTYAILGDIYNGKYGISVKNRNISRDFYKKGLLFKNEKSAFELTKMSFSSKYYKTLINGENVFYHEYLAGRLGSKNDNLSNYMFLRNNYSLIGIKKAINYYFKEKMYDDLLYSFELINDNSNNILYFKYLVSKYKLGLLDMDDFSYLEKNKDIKIFSVLLSLLHFNGILTEKNTRNTYDLLNKTILSVKPYSSIYDEAELTYIESMFIEEEYEVLYKYLSTSNNNVKYLYLALMYDRGLYIDNFDLMAISYYKIAYKKSIISSNELNNYLQNV